MPDAHFIDSTEQRQWRRETNRKIWGLYEGIAATTLYIRRTQQGVTVVKITKKKIEHFFDTQKKTRKLSRAHCTVSRQCVCARPSATLCSRNVWSDESNDEQKTKKTNNDNYYGGTVVTRARSHMIISGVELLFVVSVIQQLWLNTKNVPPQQQSDRWPGEDEQNYRRIVLQRIHTTTRYGGSLREGRWQ